jgi:hypothetical protein
MLPLDGAHRCSTTSLRCWAPPSSVSEPQVTGVCRCRAPHQAGATSPKLAIPISVSLPARRESQWPYHFAARELLEPECGSRHGAMGSCTDPASFSMSASGRCWREPHRRKRKKSNNISKKTAPWAWIVHFLVCVLDYIYSPFHCKYMVNFYRSHMGRQNNLFFLSKQVGSIPYPKIAAARAELLCAWVVD